MKDLFETLAEALRPKYVLDADLTDCCNEYISERLMDERDNYGLEVCEKYVNGMATPEEIKSLFKFFGLIQPSKYEF